MKPHLVQLRKNEQYLELMEGPDFRPAAALQQSEDNSQAGALRLVRAGTQEVPAAAHADRIRAAG